MALYLLTCDLLGDGFDYRPLWQDLSQRGAHRCTSNTWLLSSDLPARDLVADMRVLVAGQDRLLAVEVDRANCWYVNASGGTNQWLRERALVA